MSKFYSENDFLSSSEANVMYLPIEETYEPRKPIIFYGPICQFGYQFAKRTEALIKKIAPYIQIEMVNEWEKPEESIKRKTGG
jgi:hypothetical protein